MLSMVTFSKEKILNTLIQELYQPGLLEELLTENKQITIERKKKRHVLDSLCQADELIQQVNVNYNLF